MKGQFTRRDFEGYYRILRCQYLEDARSWLERSGELADAELEHRMRRLFGQARLPFGAKGLYFSYRQKEKIL